MTIRVGLIADTHCPEFLERLPEAVFERLAGVDRILHAGDVGGPGDTLQRLGRIAPVDAVRGDHDRGLPQLPAVLETEIAGRRVVVVHGNRSRLIEEPLTLFGTLMFGLWWPHPGLHRSLRRRFPRADVIVYGHTHAASITHFDGCLLVNPGAVYHVTREAADDRLRRHPGWFEWTWLQVIRIGRRGRPASVGTLEFTDTAVVPAILPL